jgi:hypothetical protein
MITEQNLIDLEFERFDETPESSGSDNNWYYYTLDIGDICLITNESDTLIEDGSWYVYLFEYDSIKITNMTDLSDFINVLKRITNEDME